MRKLIALSIFIGSFHYVPAIAAERCAIGVSAIGACAPGDHPKTERRAFRHRTVEKRR